MVRDIRRRMIERTAVLLAKHGLSGTSFKDILEAAGAPRGSLYHHCPGGKHELFVAVVDAAGEEIARSLQELTGKPAGEVARGFAGMWRTVLIAPDFPVGSAFIAVTAAAGSSQLSERASDVFRENWSRLAELLAIGGISADRAPRLALTLIAAFEGAFFVSRAQHSIELFDLITAEECAVVEAAATIAG